MLDVLDRDVSACPTPSHYSIAKYTSFTHDLQRHTCPHREPLALGAQIANSALTGRDFEAAARSGRPRAHHAPCIAQRRVCVCRRLPRRVAGARTQAIAAQHSASVRAPSTPPPGAWRGSAAMQQREDQHDGGGASASSNALEPVERLLEAQYPTYRHAYAPRDLALYALGLGCGAADLRCALALWVFSTRCGGRAAGLRRASCFATIHHSPHHLTTTICHHPPSSPPNNKQLRV